MSGICSLVNVQEIAAVLRTQLPIFPPYIQPALSPVFLRAMKTDATPSEPVAGIGKYSAGSGGKQTNRLANAVVRNDEAAGSVPTGSTTQNPSKIRPSQHQERKQNYRKSTRF
jgi:hypothetical protein